MIQAVLLAVWSALLLPPRAGMEVMLLPESSGVVGSAQALSKGPVLPRDKDFNLLVVSPGCVLH